MQTSYEIVKNSLNFNTPDRLPIDYPQLNHSDIFDVYWNQIGTGDNSMKQSVDEWGCTWSRTSVENMGLVTGHPLQNWDDLDNFVFPDADNPAFYEGMENLFEGSEDKYVRTSIFMLLFERIHSLRGFENTLIDLYVEREKLDELADKIVDFNIRIIKYFNYTRIIF